MARSKPAPAAPKPTVPVTPETWAFPSVRAEWRHLAAVVAFALGLYAFSMPRTLTLEDSGIFIMSVSVAGVSHPPGYPIHSLLGKLFTLLPFGSIPVRVHLLSAVLAALACAVLWLIVQALTSNRRAAYAAALGFAASKAFWSQSIIAEVYSLNVLLCLVLLALALEFRSSKQPRTLGFIGLVTGLCLAHHWPLAVLTFPGLALVLWPVWREVLRGLPRAVPFVVVGLLPYGWMIFRSNQDPAISFYGPLDSFDRAWFFISRKGYANQDTNLGATVVDQLKFARFFVQELILQLTPVGFGLAVLGAVAGWKQRPRTLMAGFLAIFLGASLLLVVLLKRRYGFLEQAVFQVYPLMPYAVVAAWSGFGVVELERWLSTKRPSGVNVSSSVVVASVVLLCVGVHGRQNVRRDDTWALDYARTTLELLEPNAILIVGEDTDTGPLGYLHHVEGVRPDVELYSADGLVFRNRLFRPPVSPSDQAKALAPLYAQTTRPVYVSAETPLPGGSVDFGLVRKANGEKGKSYSVLPTVAAFCQRIAARTDLTDTWDIDHRHRLLRRCGLLVGALKGAGQPVDPALEQVSQTFTGVLGIAEAQVTTLPPAELLTLTNSAEPLMDSTSPTQALGQLYNLRGFALAKSDPQAAIVEFEKGIAAHPDPYANGAVFGLLQLHAALGHKREYWELHERVFEGHTPPPQIRELDKKVGR